MRISPGEIDLKALFQHAATVVRTDVSHPFTVDVPPNLPPVQADPDRVQQVLANLLSNARKYTPDGGAIRLSARVDGDMVEVSVTDTGLALPQGAVPGLFRKFYRMDAADRRSIRGTGLGLAVVKDLVELHGGTVGVESAGAGAGSRFWFTLPIARSTHQPITPIAGLQRAPRPLRILIADDEPAVGCMVARLLRQDGYNVTAVESGDAALGKLRANSFDVLITDLHLGRGIDGLELSRAVRHEWPHVYIVLASGAEAVNAVGVNELLPKPYRPERLRRLLARLAGQTVKDAA